jgi:hypothetical protein
VSWVRWVRAQRCLYGSPTWSRWHVVGADGLTGCGYRIPVAIPTETTPTVPRWRSICTRCRREERDGLTGQLRLAFTDEEG